MKKIMDWKTASAALVVVASSFSLAACGGSGSGGGGSEGGGAAPALDADQQAVADAIATQLPENGVADAEQKKCWANGIVAGIGVDRLAELGITAESAAPIAAPQALGLTDAEANTVTDSLFSCVDIKAAMKAQLTDSLGNADIATCVTDKLDESTLKAISAAGITGQAPDAEAGQKLAEVATTCATG